MLLPHLLYSIIDPAWKVLLITSNKEKFNRANFVISKYDFAERQDHGFWLKNVDEKFIEETWIQTQDFCDDKIYKQFKKNQFDLVVCDQVLENTRDPINLCKQLERIAKRGYIEHTAPVAELIKEVEQKDVVGSPDHRWIITKNEESLIIHFKNHAIQALSEYHIPLPENRTFNLINPKKMMKFLFWEGKLPIQEDFDSADFPDWLCEEIFEGYEKSNKDVFFNLEQAMPVILNESPFKKNKIVDIFDIEIKFAIPFLKNKKPNIDLIKFENMLKQQGKL